MKENIILDIQEILSWIDEDLQKSIIPILEEVNIILNSDFWSEWNALFSFNYRIEQLYNKQDIESLAKEVKDFIKNGYEEVWKRIFEILFSKK